MTGWVQYLMVRPDAPQAVLDEAQAIADDLAGYPALDEDAWGEAEHEEVTEYWAALSVRERARMIHEYAGEEVSIFAARRNWIPQEDSGSLYDMLRS